MRVAGALGGVPLILATGPLVGYFAGRWLDGRLGTAPWLQFVFLGLGFAAAVRAIVRLVRRARKDIDRL
jgi:F0F1-type ATP synthase assembly protein I